MKAYKKVAKATIAMLEKCRDSQAKVETAGTEAVSYTHLTLPTIYSV